MPAEKPRRAPSPASSRRDKAPDDISTAPDDISIDETDDDGTGLVVFKPDPALVEAVNQDDDEAEAPAPEPLPDPEPVAPDLPADSAPKTEQPHAVTNQID